jgi:hypothetical protein
MNLGQAETVARAARTSAWFGGLAGFAATLRRSVHVPGQLLVVGSADAEPWHFTAHLESLARYRGTPALAPTLIRWHNPARGAPGMSIEEMTGGGMGRVILAISEGSSDVDLLERLADARRHGATVLGLSGQPACRASVSDATRRDDLEAVAHETHTVQSGQAVQLGKVPVLCDFELATHLVGINAVSAQGQSNSRRRLWRTRAASLSG